MSVLAQSGDLIRVRAQAAYGAKDSGGSSRGTAASSIASTALVLPFVFAYYVNA